MNRIIAMMKFTDILRTSPRDALDYILENGRVKPMTMAKKKQISSYIDSMSNKALRCIAAAYKKEDIKKFKIFRKGNNK